MSVNRYGAVKFPSIAVKTARRDKQFHHIAVKKAKPHKIQGGIMANDVDKSAMRSK